MTENAIRVVLLNWRLESLAITPVETRALYDSAVISEPYRRGGVIRGSFSYTAPYAQYVNNAPGTLKGKPRPSGIGNYWDFNGQPHFLEGGLEKIRGTIPKKLRTLYRV